MNSKCVQWRNHPSVVRTCNREVAESRKVVEGHQTELRAKSRGTKLVDEVQAQGQCVRVPAAGAPPEELEKAPGARAQFVKGNQAFQACFDPHRLSPSRTLPPLGTGELLSSGFPPTRTVPALPASFTNAP